METTAIVSKRTAVRTSRVIQLGDFTSSTGFQLRLTILRPSGAEYRAGIPSGPTGKSRSAQLLVRELRRPARRPVFSFPGLSVDAHWMATFLRQRIFYIGDIIDDAGEVVNWFFVGECLNSTVFAVSKTSHRDVFDG